MTHTEEVEMDKELCKLDYVRLEYESDAHEVTGFQVWLWCERQLLVGHLVEIDKSNGIYLVRIQPSGCTNINTYEITAGTYLMLADAIEILRYHQPF